MLNDRKRELYLKKRQQHNKLLLLMMMIMMKRYSTSYWLLTSADILMDNPQKIKAENAIYEQAVDVRRT